jgi:DNA-binding LacI/PurR family transcriptional regulator
MNSPPPTVSGSIAGSTGRGGKRARVHEYLRRRVEAGELRAGDPLPSEPSLAASVDVARGTVRHALMELEHEGVVSRIHGKGTFLRDTGSARSAERLGALALIVPQTLAGHYPALLHGFEEAAGLQHHRTVVSATDNDVARQGNIILHLAEMNVAGVAMVPSNAAPTPAYQVQALRRRRIPVVFCGRGVEGARAPLVAVPYERVGREAGNLLASHGHRRAAFFSIRRDRISRAFLDGLRQSLGEYEGAVSDKHVHTGASASTDVHLDEAAMRADLERMLAEPEPPTAVMAAFDSLGELIYETLRDMGLRIPGDVSVVSFGGADRSGVITRRLTSVTLDGADMGRRAARLLDEMNDGRRPLESDEIINMPLGLSDGGSAGPLPERRNPRSCSSTHSIERRQQQEDTL